MAKHPLERGLGVWKGFFSNYSIVLPEKFEVTELSGSKLKQIIENNLNHKDLEGVYS